MFNLQHIDGALERFIRVKDDALGPALAELESAALLSAPDLHIRFRNPSGIRGEDYEGTLVSAWGRLIPWETKSKVAASDRSATTMWRTLDEARTQLPKDGLGIILLRIPDEWKEEVTTHDLCLQAITRLYRQTRRVAAVITFSHEWLPFGIDGDVVAKPVIRKHLHPRLGDAQAEIQDILDTVGRRFNPEWANIQSLVVDALPSDQAVEARDFLARVRRSVQSPESQA